MKSILLLAANRIRPGRVHWAQEHESDTVTEFGRSKLVKGSGGSKTG